MTQNSAYDGEESEAESMANLVERWLGNPVARRTLDFFTGRSNGERRIEKALKKYAGESVNLSFSDKISYFVIEKVLDSIGKKVGLDRSQIAENLRIGYWRKGLASVLEVIAWKGPKKPFTSHCPFLVVWNFTNACNLNCKHCYQNADKPTSDELSTEEALEAVDEMADAGVAYIAMSGGEPLFRDDFSDIVARIDDNDIGFAVATNGTLLSEEKIDLLEENNCQYIEVSIDGKPETHEELRGPNTYERMMRGVKNAVESDITVGLAMTVTEENLPDVDWVIEKTEEVGADIFMHFNFIPVGRGKEIASRDLSPEEREELLKRLARESQKKDINVLSTAPQYGRVTSEGGLSTSLTHFDTVSQEEGLGEKVEFLAEFVGGCGAGRLYWGLQPNGDLTPCVFLPKTLGNIKEDDFLEIWKNHPFLERIRGRESFGGNCGLCEHRNICGGCRARSYSYFDEVQGPDPDCLKNIDCWQEIQSESD